MNVVYKYGPIQPADYVSLEMPEGAQPLRFAPQRDDVYLWALVNPEAPHRTYRFRWAGTGHEITDRREDLQYVNTFEMHGALVFHLFEVKE